MLEEIAVGEQTLVVRPGGVQVLEFVGVEGARAQQRQARQVRSCDEERAGNGDGERLSADGLQCVRSPGLSVVGVGAGLASTVAMMRRCDALRRRGRYLRMHQTARTPSRQPIFFPSS